MSKRTLFLKKHKNFFEKTVRFKNIALFVPIGRGYLGTVILKKAKKLPAGFGGHKKFPQARTCGKENLSFAF